MPARTLPQSETPNSILNKSVQLRVQSRLCQIANTSIVIDSLAAMVLYRQYREQVRATPFRHYLERPYYLQKSGQPSGILDVEPMSGIRHSELISETCA